MGKGSTRRPSSVPPAVEADNWARTFGGGHATYCPCKVTRFACGPDCPCVWPERNGTCTHAAVFDSVAQ